MDYKVTFFVDNASHWIVVSNAVDGKDAANTIREDYPHSIVNSVQETDMQSYEKRTLALSKRAIDFIIAYKFGEDGNETNYMVVKNCSSKREAEEGFRCIYKRVELSTILSIEIWDGRLTDPLMDWNVFSLEELREYENGW